MKVKEVIVVEGKHDTAVLKSCIDCDTIETHGTAIPADVLRQISEAKKTRGVIIFTDPDYPGEYIRKTINQAVPGCLQAYIDKKKARTTKKVGVEHADKQALLDALAHVFTYDPTLQDTLSWEAYLSLGLTGRVDSAQKRALLASKLYIGKPNAKTLFKRLNMLQLDEAAIKALLDTSGDDEAQKRG